MAGELYDYDITQVSVLITTALGVTIDVTGGEKEKVKYKRAEEIWKTKMDVSGAMARGWNPNQSGEASIFLLAENPMNEKIQGLYEAGQDVSLRKILMDTFTICVIDRLAGKPKMLGRNAFIQEMPEGTEEIEPTQNEWKILIPKINIFKLGGLFRP